MLIQWYFSNLRQITQTLHHPVSGADTQTGSGCCDVQQKNVWHDVATLSLEVTLKSHHHPI